MRFERKTVSKRKIRLSDLEVGDIFFFNNCAFMVIPTDEMEAEWRSAFATINLQSGDTSFFDQDMEVAKLNKEIVIDYELSDLQEWI